MKSQFLRHDITGCENHDHIKDHQHKNSQKNVRKLWTLNCQPRKTPSNLHRKSLRVRSPILNHQLGYTKVVKPISSKKPIIRNVYLAFFKGLMKEQGWSKMTTTVQQLITLYISNPGSLTFKTHLHNSALMSLGRLWSTFPPWPPLNVSLDTLPGKKQGSLQWGTKGGLDTHGLLGSWPPWWQWDTQGDAQGRTRFPPATVCGPPWCLALLVPSRMGFLGIFVNPWISTW